MEEQKKEAGNKEDAGKLRLDLIPFASMMGMATVLTDGASRYGDRNWEKGISWSRVFGALLRHLFAWWFRIDLDEKSKLHHLNHALCCLAFLRHYTMFNLDKDDRPHYAHGPKVVKTLLDSFLGVGK